MIKEKVRDKTHWCVVDKHSKCGGKVSKLLKTFDENIINKLDPDNYSYSLCYCTCHYKKI